MVRKLSNEHVMGAASGDMSAEAMQLLSKFARGNPPLCCRALRCPRAAAAELAGAGTASVGAAEGGSELQGDTRGRGRTRMRTEQLTLTPLPVRPPF